ncbi:MAG: lipopolysaccharide kinase InaA family protein [Phycisphaeraceae bacterium]
MDVLSHSGYEQMVQGARALAKNAWGVSVMQLVDGQWAKLFRPPRLLSSARFYPYAVRFQHAARELKKRGVRTVEVTAVWRVKGLNRHVVVYRPVDGMELRELLADAARRSRLLPALSGFIAELHRKGVYFRSLHLGNVLWCPDDVFALIDVSATRFKPRPLPPLLRARSFKRMCNYEQDRQALQSYGFTAFMRRYLDEAGLPASTQRTFLRCLRRRCPEFQQSLLPLINNQEVIRV